MGFLDLLGGSYPPLVEEATEEIRAMVRTGRHMFAAASAHLLENEVLEDDLSVMDDKINTGEQRIRRTVFEHLSLHPEQDLIFSLKLVSIVHEAERIGDLAKSIAKVSALAQSPRMGPRVQPLRGFRDDVMDMFVRLDEGFFNGNEQESRKILETHLHLKAHVAKYITELAQDPDLSGNEGVVYALSARMLNRVSAHIANIASTVVSPLDQIRRTAAWPEDI
jgi:phosphate uptake regulator